MVVPIISFACGIWLLQLQAELPPLSWSLFLLPLLAAFRLPDAAWHGALRRVLLLALAAGCGYFYAAVIAQHRLADRLPDEWEGRDIEIVGIVAEMPRQHERGLRFRFEVEQVVTAQAHVPRHLLLSTYNNEVRPAPAQHAGERWHLTVRLKQPHGTSNPHTFDFEAWMLERNLRASGYVHAKGANRLLDERPYLLSYRIERLRESIRDQFRNTLGESPVTGILTALAIGDQASIPPGQWQIFTRTGVNHLMAISGLHITLFSGLVFSLAGWGWRRSPRLLLMLPARKAAALAGLTAALAYTLLSGYGIPAQRTLYMLTAMSALLLASRNASPAQYLALALLAVLLIDPWAVLSPGFWLSFGAVALIFLVSAHRIEFTRTGAPDASWAVRLRQRLWQGGIQYGRIQWAMSIGLIPLMLALFQQVSLVSPLANFFAIPLVSFVVVPLALLAAIPGLDSLLHPAGYFMQLCLDGLTWLNRLPSPVWVQHAPPAWSIVLAFAGVVWILLPRGFPARWLGWLLLLPMFLNQPAPPAAGSVQITIFDVGQGLAVAARTAQHALLYDTGPDFDSEANSGNRILIPALRGMGIAQLDKLILSHDDTDHTGGTLPILQDMPVIEVSSPLAADHPLLALAERHAPCRDGQAWEWDGVHFEVLHPAAENSGGKKKHDNDTSCVLRIGVGAQSLLLAGDIERAAEQRLLAIHADRLPSTILVAPHHGSKSSSGAAFVDAVRPRHVVFTVGYRNRFGHPRPEIVERYRTLGSELLRSDEDGAINVKLDENGTAVQRHRDTHQRYWHIN